MLYYFGEILKSSKYLSLKILLHKFIKERKPKFEMYKRNLQILTARMNGRGGSRSKEVTLDLRQVQDFNISILMTFFN
jgi:hypothetical protein